MNSVEIVLLVGLGLLLVLGLAFFRHLCLQQRALAALPVLLAQDMEVRHRAVLTDLHTVADVRG